MALCRHGAHPPLVLLSQSHWSSSTSRYSLPTSFELIHRHSWQYHAGSTGRHLSLWMRTSWQLIRKVYFMSSASVWALPSPLRCCPGSLGRARRTGAGPASGMPMECTRALASRWVVLCVSDAPWRASDSSCVFRHRKSTGHSRGSDSPSLRSASRFTICFVHMPLAPLCPSVSISVFIASFR